MNIRLLIAASLFISISTNAQLVGNDYTYRQKTSGNHRVIFSEEYDSLADSAFSKYLWLHQIYPEEFKWEFDEDSVLVLASSKNQVPNGFATQYPRLMTYFYNGGPEFIDEFAITSWLDVLLTHETVHLYQLNVRRQYSSYLKKAFGNALPSMALPFTYTITPHLFTPTFLMEGNATFNEGRFGNGGRLYSGYFRALFLQLLKDGKVTSHRLMNDHIDWPFGTEKYFVGGYFFSQLAQEVGASRANAFFNAHTYRYMFPLRINATFVDVFDVGYRTVFENLEHSYSDLVQNQKSLSTSPIAFTYDHAGFVKQMEKVLFMINDYQDLPKACEFNLSNSDLNCSRKALPFGRLFLLGEEFATSAYSQTHPTEIRAGLFKEGYERVEAYNDQYVYQLSDKGHVYADAKDSFDRVRVFKNGVPLGDMQSSPFMDTAGSVYYFKQLDSRRQLYKDDKFLFQIEGHYGRVVDVDNDGHIYFTAAIPTGTSLFRWDGKKIVGVIKSDLIIDAKLLNSKSALVAEVTSRGIEYRVADLETRDLAPVLYTYKDPLRDEAELATKFQTAGSLKNKAKSIPSTVYHPLSEMEFNGLDPMFGSSDPGGAFWVLNARFSDPLQKYFFNILLGDAGWHNYVAQASFLSQANRISWGLTALYEQDAIIETPGPTELDRRVLGRFSETTLAAQAIYPLFKTPIWNSDISATYSYESVSEVDPQIRTLVDAEYVNGIELEYDLSYAFQNLLDHSYSRLLSFELIARHEGEGSDWDLGTQVYRGRVDVQKDILWQTFFSASYDAAITEGPRKSLTLEESPILPFDSTEFSQLSERFLTGGFYELRKLTVELRQGIRWGLYHRWFPIGLRRLAPFVGYSEFYGSQTRDVGAETLFHEAYAGLELELLILHKFPARIQILKAENSLDPDPDLLLTVKQAWNF